MPKDIDDRARINSAGGGVHEREVQANRREDGKLHYQERVAVIWIEKVKTMGPCALDGVEGGRGSAEDRMILVDMSNVGMFKRVHKTASNPPVKVVVSDVRALGNRNHNRGRMVGGIRHTLGRRDPANGDKCQIGWSEDSDLLVFVS